MATLTIRNLPDALHARLKERARLNRRSLNQEVIAELETVGVEAGEEGRLAAARERMRLGTEKIDTMRSRMTRFLTTEEIDAAIKEGRR